MDVERLKNVTEKDIVYASDIDLTKYKKRDLAPLLFCYGINKKFAVLKSDLEKLIKEK